MKSTFKAIALIVALLTMLTGQVRGKAIAEQTLHIPQALNVIEKKELDAPDEANWKSLRKMVTPAYTEGNTGPSMLKNWLIISGMIRSDNYKYACPVAIDNGCINA